jgi:catechol 2,3-dioxygenase-like lactoylglutathione lyase family enzyme
MIRFRVGTSEIKLQATPAAKDYPSGAIKDATGLRVFTFFFPDEAALTARFTAHGYPAPQFRKTGPAESRALVLDPASQWVELVVRPGAPAETFDRLEVGLTVSNLERSRAFYRRFVGLEELPPVEDPVVGATKYPFRHGTTTVNVWSFGTGLPANTRSAGIQYVVRDATAVDAKAKEYGATIDQPLRQSFANLLTVWLADPDGITNYFAQILRRTDAAPPSASSR